MDLLFAIMIAASSAAFFCALQACRILSATILPAATRLGFFAGLVVGVAVVACCVGAPPSDTAVPTGVQGSDTGVLSGISVDIVQRYMLL